MLTDEKAKKLSQDRISLGLNKKSKKNKSKHQLIANQSRKILLVKQTEHSNFVYLTVMCMSTGL